MRKEPYGYFPYPIKWIDGKWRINFDKGIIPLGAEIISINKIPIAIIIDNLSKYYTTDGVNITGKRIGMRTHFPRYFRWHYGLTDNFEVEYCLENSKQKKTEKLKSVSYLNYYKSFKSRHSKPFDEMYYVDLVENQKYKYEKIDNSTGILTVHTFDMGDENTDEHKRYCKFLDRVFSDLKVDDIKNLIVDVRLNGGGKDPNDLVTFSYLTKRKFQENKDAWISFQKIPLLRYIDFWLPKFLRPFFVCKYNKMFKKQFPLNRKCRFYQDENSKDHIVREPNINAFLGDVYLLTSPAVASAGSLFAAMVVGNENTITVGEETMGGYYGHNGHTALAYKLPNSKIETYFSVVNLEQDVPKKSNQIYGRGIIPDHLISQTFEDFINNEDTQLKYVFELIRK